MEGEHAPGWLRGSLSRGQMGRGSAEDVQQQPGYTVGGGVHLLIRAGGLADGKGQDAPGGFRARLLGGRGEGGAVCLQHLGQIAITAADSLDQSADTVADVVAVGKSQRLAVLGVVDDKRRLIIPTQPIIHAARVLHLVKMG